MKYMKKTEGKFIFISTIFFESKRSNDESLYRLSRK